MAAEYAGIAALDLTAPQGRVRTRPASPWHHDPVSDVPRKGLLTNAFWCSSGFRGDLNRYMAHQQQSFKEARDARGTPLWRYKDARRVREGRNTEIVLTIAGVRTESTTRFWSRRRLRVGEGRYASQTRPALDMVVGGTGGRHTRAQLQGHHERANSTQSSGVRLEHEETLPKVYRTTDSFTPL